LYNNFKKIKGKSSGANQPSKRYRYDEKDVKLDESPSTEESEDEDESASAANQVINPQTKSFVGIFIILIVHFCQMISIIFFVFVKDIQRN
jgi:hypothetical protein